MDITKRNIRIGYFKAFCKARITATSIYLNKEEPNSVHLICFKHVEELYELNKPFRAINGLGFSDDANIPALVSHQALRWSIAI